MAMDGQYIYLTILKGICRGGFIRITPDSIELENFKNWGDGSSNVLKKQTLKEFHLTIDNVIDELKFNPDDFVKFQKWRSEDTETQLFYLHKVLPVYIKLREMGYKHYPDLTA